MTRRQRRFAAAAAAAAVVALAGGVAAAAESPPGDAPGTAVTIEGCAEAMATAVRGHVALELRELSIGEGPAAPASGDRIVIVCADGAARISVRGSDQGQEIARTVDLAGFPADAAPRAVALAAIEALAALTRQRAAAKPAAVEPRRPAPVSVVAAAPVAKAPPARPTTVLVLSGAWRTFLDDAGLSLWGAALNVDREIGRRFDLGFDVELASGGRSQVPFGETTGLSGSARGSFGLRGGWRALRGVVSLGGRLGVARLVGKPQGGSAAFGGDEGARPWGGPVLSAAVLGVYHRIGLRAAAEAGYAAIGATARAEEAVVAAMRGPWINLTLGVGFLP